MRKSFSLAFVIMFALMFALICIITGCELDDPMDLTCTLDGETYEHTLYSTSYPTIKLTIDWNKAVKVMTYRKLPGASAYSLVDSKVVTMGINNKGTYTYKASANDLGSSNNMLPTEYRIEVYSNDDNTLKTTFETSLQPVTGTDIPTAWVNTANNAAIVDKETWIDGTMELEGTDYDISIKGRGHKSWEQVKKPYAIKLDSKASLLGMPKGKRWVLIANYLDNSFLKNSAAFLVSEALGMDYTVRGDFVHLVLNG